LRIPKSSAALCFGSTRDTILSALVEGTQRNGTRLKVSLLVKLVTEDHGKLREVT